MSFLAVCLAFGLVHVDFVPCVALPTCFRRLNKKTCAQRKARRLKVFVFLLPLSFVLLLSSSFPLLVSFFLPFHVFSFVF